MKLFTVYIDGRDLVCMSENRSQAKRLFDSSFDTDLDLDEIEEHASNILELESVINIRVIN